MTSKALIWLKEVRLQFCTASVIPVFIGTSLAYSHFHKFDLTLFLLASFSIALFQMGANVINDYFDNVSKNDWVNENPTPFSGGSRLIQKNLLTPKEVYIGSIALFTTGSILGLIIVLKTKSLLVLLLGLIGLLGGFSYTAPPLKFGYRTIGEIVIGFLFGILPVYGAYYIQTFSIDWIPLLPAVFIAILIFLVIYANEFSDYPADKAVNKNTLVVALGIKKAAVLYRAAIIVIILLSFILVRHPLPYGFIFYLLMLLLSFNCLKTCDIKKLFPGYSDLSRHTIILHTLGGLALSAAILFL